MIGTGKDAAGRFRDAHGVGAGIGALIVKKLVVDGEQSSALVDSGADLVSLLA
jgi:hypothetical protein